MYKKPIYKSSKLKINNTVEGETMEQKVKRVLTTKEPITDGAPLVYTEKGEIPPGFNVRTDKWEYAVEAIDKIARMDTAKGNMSGVMKVVEDEEIKNGEEPGTHTTNT